MARCTECRHFFCRECISEYEERSVCAACLVKFFRKPKTERRFFTGALRVVQMVVAVMVVWFVFYLIGACLASIPASFHAGSLWQTPAEAEK